MDEKSSLVCYGILNTTRVNPDASRPFARLTACPLWQCTEGGIKSRPREEGADTAQSRSESRAERVEIHGPVDCGMCTMHKRLDIFLQYLHVVRNHHQGK